MYHTMSHTNIYVVACQGGRFYVGKSDNVQKRFEQHLNGGGSAWTRKYKPISLAKVFKNVSHFEEDKVVKEYMDKYGIDKVRGGSYVEIELSDLQKEGIQKEIWAAKDLCTRCGGSGHFVKDCEKGEEEGDEEDEDDDDDDDDDGDDDDDEEDEVVWECEYCEREFTTEYGCSVHEKSCKKANTRTPATPTRGSGACFRCGRQGHYSPDCYASRHLKGYELD